MEMKQTLKNLLAPTSKEIPSEIGLLVSVCEGFAGKGLTPFKLNHLIFAMVIFNGRG